MPLKRHQETPQANHLYFPGAGVSTAAVLTVEVSQARLEEPLEGKGAGEPNSHAPGVSCDHRADLEQLEPDGTNLGASQLGGLEALTTQGFQ